MYDHLEKVGGFFLSVFGTIVVFRFRKGGKREHCFLAARSELA